MAPRQGTGVPYRAGEPDAVAADSARAQLEQVLASKAFAFADRQRRFLRFIVEQELSGRGGDIKEYLLGVEVFDRAESFDPRVDALVRVEARSLRVKLREYYETEGHADPVLIELPKGHYVPVFRLRTPPAAAAEAVAAPAAGWLRRHWRAGIVAGLALLAGGAGVAYRLAAFRPPLAPASSIAVIPFANLTGDAEYEYFADGLVDEITTALAKIEGLRVVARTSAFQFTPKGGDVRGIGQRLRVGAVLEGSIRRQGARLRVTAQLINTADGYHLWSETYERDTRDMFAVQDEITAAVSRALRLRLAGDPAARAATRRAQDPHAQELLWRGRHWRNQLTAEGFRKSVEYYGESLKRDPEYPEVWSALADAYSVMGFHGIGPASEMRSKAKEAARRALALDDAMADAHAALAWVLLYHDWDWPGAEREFRRALELSPGFARARMRYAFGLASRGRFEEATAQARTAIDLEPLPFLSADDLGVILYFSRRYEEAMAQSRQTPEAEPVQAPARAALLRCLVAQGRYAAAIAEFEKSPDPALRFMGVPGRLGYAYAAVGRRDQAFRLLQQLPETDGQNVDACVHRAFVYAALGEKDRAFEYLQRALQRREPELSFLAVEPLWDSLRADPRFAALKKRMGL